MASCEFTEFSYGYALTDSLAQSLLLGSSPVFPSLFQEGSVGGGYDVMIPAYPLPIFLQFKIPQVMVKASNKRPPDYPIPYYRMPIRTKRPNQHRLLRRLESMYPLALVAYATPLFHIIADLNAHYLNSDVHQHSGFILPSSIGALDSKPHHISYFPGVTPYWIHSNPTELQGDFSIDTFRELVLRRRANLGERFKETKAKESAAYQGLVLDESILALRKASGGARNQSADNVLLPVAQSNASLSVRYKRLAYICLVHFGLTLMLVDAD